MPKKTSTSNNGAKGGLLVHFTTPVNPLSAELRDAGFHVRPFEPGDMMSIREIFATGMLGYTTGMREDDPLKGAWEAYVKGALAADLKDASTVRDVYFRSGGSFWVIVDLQAPGSPIVGHVGCEGLSTTTCELRRMSVRPGARRAGLGSKLVRVVEEYAAAHGYKEVVLTTGSIMRPARALYHRTGFELYRKGFMPGAAPDPVNPEAVFYEAAYRKPVSSNQGRWVWQPFADAAIPFTVEAARRRQEEEEKEAASSRRRRRRGDERKSRL